MPRNNKNAHKMLFMLQVENEICITDHNIFFFHEILHKTDKSVLPIKS